MATFPPPDPGDIVVTEQDGKMFVHEVDGVSVYLSEAFPMERKEALRDGGKALRNRVTS